MFFLPALASWLTSVAAPVVSSALTNTAGTIGAGLGKLGGALSSIGAGKELAIGPMQYGMGGRVINSTPGYLQQLGSAIGTGQNLWNKAGIGDLYSKYKQGSALVNEIKPKQPQYTQPDRNAQIQALLAPKKNRSIAEIFASQNRY